MALCAAHLFFLPVTALETQTFNNNITFQFQLDPPAVDPARDAVLTLTVTTPVGVEAVLPDLRDRFRGFSRVEDLSKEPVTDNNVTRREILWRLTPEPVPESGYSLRPFAVTLHGANSEESSFATKPIVFTAVPLPAFVEGEIQADLKPVRIPPTPRMVAVWSLWVLLALAVLALVVFASLHVRRAVREHRMSPGERAFAELNRLLHRGYIEKGLYKDFYIELTHVVRRYIERAHGIHAPTQTTEEFLLAATRHPRFQGETLQRLREFLESADLVKFAGVTSTPALADASTAAARRYIATDNIQPKEHHDTP